MIPLDEDLQALESTAPPTEPWPRVAGIPDRLAAARHSPDAFRQELSEANAELFERFRADESIEILVRARADLIDAILREVWRSQVPAGYENWTLAAVGGYGRGELHPHSDIDILILVPSAPDDAGRAVVERLVTFLWDINLEVGSGTQAEQTAGIMVGYEKVLLKERSDLCLVVGDVTSTMACSIAASRAVACAFALDFAASDPGCVSIEARTA